MSSRLFGIHGKSPGKHRVMERVYDLWDVVKPRDKLEVLLGEIDARSNQLHDIALNSTRWYLVKHCIVKVAETPIV